MQCIARCKSNPFKQCSLKAKCNKLCNKHNEEQNVKTIDEELFTKKEKNIFIKNYIDTLNINTKKSETLLKNNITLAKEILQYYNYKFDINLKNKEVILFFKEYISNNSSYVLDLKKIIKIQSLFRKKYISFINKLKGPGLLKSCVNETDFYTFEKKDKINYNYFFSFQDEKHNIYFFDIRSFKLLIDNKTNDIINPYNRNIIKNHIVEKYNTLIENLKKNNISIEFEPEILSPEQLFNQKIIEIFQKMDSFGYNTSIEWFTELSIFHLRKMWIGLEDIWNYRSNLNMNDKNSIIQKTKPQPFSKFKLMNTKYFYNQNKNLDKRKIQETILDDINIFITSGINKDSCNIGCLYVLTALSQVSKNCLEAMPWLAQY